VNFGVRKLESCGGYQSCGVICEMLSSAVLIQYRSVTHTHTETDRHKTQDDGIYRTSIASRGLKTAVYPL